MEILKNLKWGISKNEQAIGSFFLEYKEDSFDEIACTFLSQLAFINSKDIIIICDIYSLEIFMKMKRFYKDNGIKGMFNEYDVKFVGAISDVVIGIHKNYKDKLKFTVTDKQNVYHYQFLN